MGYGLSGNQDAIDSYNSLRLMKPNGVVSVNGAPTVTLGTIRNANPDLKWEVKRTFNAGIDAGFFDNRFILAVDYYNSKTDDMLYLYDVSVPPSLIIKCWRIWNRCGIVVWNWVLASHLCVRKIWN